MDWNDYDNELTFSCGKGRNKWQGSVSPTSTAEVREFRVKSRSTDFVVIVGKCSRGNYVCIPNWNIGSELAELNDKFWNREHLEQIGMSEADATSIAEALAAIGSLYTFYPDKDIPF